jgi:tetratricopeptide (TPR) repeat protein
MSLLMDALKQAEHAKRDKPIEAPAPRPGPGSVPDTVESARPELSLAPAEAPPRPEPAEETFTAPPSAASTPPHEAMRMEAAPAIAPQAPSTPGAPGAQTAARILAASAAQQAAQRRRNAFGLTGLGVVLTLAIGGYYYYAALAQPQPFTNLPSMAPPVVAEQTLPDVAQADAAQSLGPAVVAHIATDTPPPEQTPWREGTPPAAIATAEDWQPAPIDPRALRGERSEPAMETPAATATPAPAIRISRGSRPDQVNTTLQDAYADFRAGRWVQAEQAYREVLAREPGNRDAHLGLAALALRADAPDTARMHYRELLRRNPKDAAAYSALVELDAHRGAGSESELKLRLAEQPQSAQLHFALANLYAAQQRWPLAQQAYFEAQRLTPDHPDYAFNLAVSLEHVGQPRLAQDYYRRALQLSAARDAQFDPDTARQRIALLTAAAQP